MSALRITSAMLGAALLFGCQETEECKRLSALKADYQEAAVRMRARAGLRDKALERAAYAEKSAKALLAKLGLDKTETEMDAVLKDRAQALGVDLERGTREVPLGDGADAATEKQTVWSFSLKGSDTAAAVDMSRQLAGSPPLFRYVALLGDGETWRFRLAKATVDQPDLSKITPTPPPKRKRASDIESEWGFCGASALRGEIATLDAEIEELQKLASETTIAMPKAASWEGVRRRVLQQQAEEGEARAILDEQLTAAVRARVPIKAAGVEGAVVILELRGGPKEKKRFQSELSEKGLEALRPADTERPGLIRYMTVIPAADMRRKKGHGGGGGGGPQHEGH